MTESIKPTPAKPDAETKNPKKTQAALDEKQLDKVNGGTASTLLGNACATGKHIKSATITH